MTECLIVDPPAEANSFPHGILTLMSILLQQCKGSILAVLLAWQIGAVAVHWLGSNLSNIF